MRSTRSLALAISTAALLAAMTPGTVRQASAETLFEFLFNRQPRREAPPEPAPVKRAAPPRIKGPSYYTYKTDPLVRVDFAAIEPHRDREAALTLPQAGQGTGEVQVAQLDDAAVTSDATTGDVLDDKLPKGEAAAPAATEPAAETAPGAAQAQPGVAGEKVVEESSQSPAPSQAVTAAETGDDMKPARENPVAAGTVETEPAPAAAEVETAPADAAPAEAAQTSPVKKEPAPAVADEKPAGEESAPATVAEEEPAPQPLTDAQIAGLQEFELLAEKEAAEAIVAHYSAVPEFIWVSDGAPNERARAAMRTLADAASHGLDPRDYAVAAPSSGDPAALAAFEMELSARILRYAHDARSGRIDPNRISGYHDFAAEPLDRVAVLALARRSDDIAAFLEAQHPTDKRYKALRVELEALRASAENEIVIAPDTLVRPGETDPEFDKILSLISQKADEAFRAAHGEVLTRHLGSDMYAQELVPVVKAAQEAAGVGADGVIGPRTVHALAGDSKAERIAKVEVALEQLRWLPSQLADRHVFINTPAFNATYVEDGEVQLSMRVVVGGRNTQTSFFQDKIEYVEFHPYWGVPRSILVNEYLPKLIRDPGYLDRAGFEVTNRRGQRVASASVNWGAYGADIPFDVRQLPGSSNALGELKILFPNKHAIYMHDTPAKQLFSRDMRALSHGCIRLQDPRAMAAAVLGWDRARLGARLEQPHSREDLAVEIPVYVAYFTAWPDATGTVQYFGDIYDRDARTLEAIEKVEALRAPAG